MTHEEINELMIAAQARAKARGETLLKCPVGDCEWSTENVKGAAKYLRRHLVAVIDKCLGGPGVLRQGAPNRGVRRYSNVHSAYAKSKGPPILMR
jgi:hypothetical protein